MASYRGEVDMEAFQRLSDNYRPDVQGPLIRQRYPIQTLLEEFNNADPTYVTKTAALSVSYSQYRPVKGDGQCGWRAVVFGYFECLLSQPIATLVAEKTRFQEFNDTLVAVGYDISMVEGFVDETLELFGSLHEAIESGSRSDQLLIETFNDENRSNSIVFHFKLMTSATMKMHPDQYQPYLVQPLYEYCQSNVDAFGQEIEQISLQALTDGVIAPARINVMVMYLDRSEGGEVTPHHLVANAAPDWPAITLLYRPGHYDMIYKAGPIRAHRVQVDVEQAQFVPTTTFETNDADLRLLSQLNESQSLMEQSVGGKYSSTSGEINLPCTQFVSPFVPATNAAEHHDLANRNLLAPFPTFNPQYRPSDLAPSSYESLDDANKMPDHGADSASFIGGFPTSSDLFHPPMLVPQQQLSLVSRSSSNDSLSSPAQPVVEKHELQIRMSRPCYEMGKNRHEILPLETGPFKNSPFNRSHFANPDFQPLMWNAEQDYGRER